ncbi:MAG TPA: CIA30 family protein [Vicinamibacteria bacterium]|jgi:hypothetical protein
MNGNALILAVAIPSAMTASMWAEKQPPGVTIHARTVDDFEDGDRRAPSGLSWISIADDLMGGASIAELRVTAPGARSRHALRVTGDVAAGGFAGAWVALDGHAQPMDVTDFEGIRLRIRGNGPLQLGLRAGPLPGVNYMAPVEAGADWTQVAVPLASLRAASQGAPAIDLRTARWLGISTASGRTGRFEFEIDDVELYTPRADAQLRVQSAPTFAVRFEPSPASELPPGPWKELAQDPPDDGKQKRLPDATALAVCLDDAHDRVWFRIALAASLPTRWLGANLALDVDGDPNDGMAWWGTNTAFHFDRLVTVYGLETGSGYEGTIGIADAADVQAGRMNGSGGERVLVVLDSAKPAFVIGIPRSALGTGPTTTPIRILAAVGSAFQHNDDVPNEGAALLSR